MSARRVLAAFAICVPALVASGAETVQLTGAATQGGLMRGRVPPNAAVYLDGTALRVSRAGHFVFGFGRDAKGERVLEVRFGDGRIERRTISIAPRRYQVERIDGLAPNLVTPGKKALARIRVEAARIAAVRARDSDNVWFAEPFGWPVEGRISGVYGSQRILNGKPRRPHYGLDIAAPPGTPVVAPAGGIVALAEADLFFTGGTVMLDHGHGVTSIYSHLATLAVAEGQWVEKGDRLGAVGATGRATGPHLDWRVNWFAERIDPALLVEEAR